jgi:hypothetical protein
MVYRARSESFDFENSNLTNVKLIATVKAMLMTPHQAAAAVSLMIMHPLRLPLHHAAPLRPRTPQLLLKMMLQIQQAHLHLVRFQVVLAP